MQAATRAIPTRAAGSRSVELRAAALVALLLAPVPWVLAFGGDSFSTVRTSGAHVALLLALTFAPCLLTDPRQAQARTGAALLMAGGLLLELVTVWSHLIAHRHIGPKYSPAPAMPEELVLALAAPWVLLTLGLWFGRGLRIGWAAFAAAMMVSVAPATTAAVVLFEPPRHAVTASGIAATLWPPAYEQRGARTLDWAIARSAARSLGPDIPQGTVLSTEVACDVMRNRCEWTRTDSYQVPPLPGRDTLLVDWVVVTDLQGRYGGLQIRRAQTPVARGVHRRLVGWFAAVAATFMILCGSLAAALRMGR